MQEKINHTFSIMADEINSSRKKLLELNAKDVETCDKTDIALFDRLHLDDSKIDGMIDALLKVKEKESPLGKTLYKFTHENGMLVENKTVPFGTILIVYESRPDVTVEATATALKSGNKILLKGGKEAKNSNLFLHQCWVNALQKAALEKDRVRYLNMDRTSFQAYLKNPDTPIDLIIPRGGEKLIAYVHSVAQCPVLVSGRGNNFLYVSEYADLSMAQNLIIQSKVSKISACNALDKVLIHKNISPQFKTDLQTELQNRGVAIIAASDDAVWMEEFLDMKIVLSEVVNTNQAIQLINKYSGKHSATIVSNDDQEVQHFMNEVDCAAVYHNASTRFTDGFQFGLGAEMAISTEKLHHRGPLGIEHLVTNKWYIKGNGQTR